MVVGFVLSSFSSDKNSQQPVWQRVGVKYFYLSVTLSDIGGKWGREGGREGFRALWKLNTFEQDPGIAKQPDASFCLGFSGFVIFKTFES